MNGDRSNLSNEEIGRIRDGWAVRPTQYRMDYSGEDVQMEWMPSVLFTVNELKTQLNKLK